MSAIHVVVRDSAQKPSPLEPLRGVLDIVIDGVNIMARVGENQALALLSELGHAVAGIVTGRQPRTTAQICCEDQAWELGLEADGSNTLLSVYRTGPCPEVAVHERAVSTEQLRAAVIDAIERVIERHPPRSMRSVLRTARSLLGRPAQAKVLARNIVQDRVAPPPIQRVALSAAASFRCGQAPRESALASVERSDLHSLLIRGSFRMSSGPRAINLERVQVFLLAERLLWMAEDVLDSWQSARPVFRRLHLEGTRLGVRRGPGDGLVAVTFAASDPGGKSLTLSDLDPTVFVEATAQFAEALATRFIEHDPSQANNLRLGVLRENSRLLLERLDDVRADDSVTNGEPDTYRSFGLPSVIPTAEGVWSSGGEIRFHPRWIAAVPNVDLRSTFLLEDRLIVSSSREVASIESRTGEIAWRITTDRAATVATPTGLARLHADGRLRIHDLDTGGVRSVTRLTPRAGGGAAGALVNTPGLPRLLLVAEGDRSVTAVDLVSGDVRWRHRGRRPASYRLRRAGKLVLVSGGDSSLQALDVSSGEIVWKVRDRLPFTGDVVATGDSAFAISSSAIGSARLHHIDVWTGQLRWTADLEEHPVYGQAPLVAGDAIVVPTRDRRGVGAIGLHFETGAQLWEHEPGLSSPTTSWLAVEDTVIANSASGTLLCLDARTGEPRYNHVFSRHVEADQPRRLDPILRNGALFVPQHEVQVLRPRTGEIIGSVPCDLIPDLLKVDEECNVYIAEESGHLAAFSAGAQLRLVR